MGNSASARRLRYAIEQGDWSIDQRTLLSQIADMMDIECEHNDISFIKFDQSHTYFEYPKIKSASVLLLELSGFITSYVEHSGPCTRAFIQRLYHYIGLLDSIFEVYEKRLNKLNKIETILKEKLGLIEK